MFAAGLLTSLYFCFFCGRKAQLGEKKTLRELIYGSHFKFQMLALITPLFAFAGKQRGACSQFLFVKELNRTIAI
ncbi:MAG: hypothetical protein WC374_09370 [Phycisphaerae bacterium]